MSKENLALVIVLITGAILVMQIKDTTSVGERNAHQQARCEPQGT